MRCNKCGRILNANSTFCPNCGALIEKNQNNTSDSNSESLLTQTTNQKKVIIITILLIILIAVIICFLIFKNTGQVVNMKGIDVWLPNDFSEHVSYTYDLAYSSADENIVVGVIIKDSNKMALDEYEKNIDKGTEVASMICKKENEKTINGRKWAIFSCTHNTKKATLYLTIKNNKLYGISIETKASSDVNISKLQNEN